MNVNIYSIFDSAAKAYGRPLFLKTDGLAMRVFVDAVNSLEDSDIRNHPEQFTLFKIGEFDDSTGTLSTEAPPVLLAKGHEVKNVTTTTEELN